MYWTGIGAWYAYSAVSAGHSTGSATALILTGWFFYAAIYGLAGICTLLYMTLILSKRDPERCQTLRQTGAQALIGSDAKGLVWGIGALIIILAFALYGALQPASAASMLKACSGPAGESTIRDMEAAKANFAAGHYALVKQQAQRTKSTATPASPKERMPTSITTSIRLLR